MSARTHGYNDPNKIVGNRWAGFDTMGNWSSRLGMTMTGLSTRLRKLGEDDIRAFDYPRPNLNRTGATGKLVTDPFTGIRDNLTGHARRLGINQETFTKRLNDETLLPEYVWLQDIEHTEPVVFQTAKAKLITNPFNGRTMYKNEWAEMLNMTINSFKARLTRWGSHDRRTWEVLRRPNYRGRNAAKRRS